MAFKTKKITIENIDYVVKQQNMGVLRPILMLPNQSEIPHEIMRVSIFRDDQPILDAIDELSFGAYSKLATIANEINGIAANEDEEVKN